jgi:uncharacterized protein (TIGR02001 family)
MKLETKSPAASVSSTLRRAALASAVAVGFASSAYADIAGNIGMATDYRFRGISQTDRDPQVYGGFDFTAENGIYAGIWGSNVAFGSSLELDYYAGYRGKISDDVGYDVGYVYYNYPSDNSDPDLDYGEIYGSVTVGGFKAGLNYSNDYFAETDTYWYLYGQYTHNITESVAVSASVGYNKFDGSDSLASFLVTDNDPDDNYIDWKVSVSTTWQGLGWSLSYIDTNLSKDDCGGSELCSGTVVAGISKSL